LLRKALDDSGERYIETVPRRGYRFAAAISKVEPEPAQAVPLPVSPVAPASRRRRPPWPWVVFGILALGLGGLIYWQFYVPSKYLPYHPNGASIAVVPFHCLTADQNCKTFSQSLDELLVAELSKVEWIQVVSLSTVRRHQQFGNSMGLMGRLLRLDALVEGSVQYADKEGRITVNLVDVHTGRIIWADSHELQDAPSASLQAHQARRISASVAAHLAIQHPTRNN
jgi:TolB-like protein